MDIKTQLEVLTNNIEIFLPENSLEERLKLAIKENRPLRVKLGFDPTAPDLHLGHSVILKKLRDFQNLGHQVIIIIGDFTARIGDPTGKNKTRPPLTEEQVNENAKTYISQLSKVLDISKVQIRHNSEWFSKMDFSEIIKLLSQMTLAQIMQRTDFNNRFQNNTPISLHELAYPLLQGYDSVMIEADIEMGGTDQLFNCTVGRHLQELRGELGQIVACMPLLRGVDGTAKMSKSENNYIGLIDTPNQIYGKTMSIPDNLIFDYLKLVTNFNSEEQLNFNNLIAQGENPMKIKKEIAYNLVEQYHNLESAIEAKAFFENQFQSKKEAKKSYLPFTINSSIELEETVLNLQLTELCKLLKPSESKSHFRRMIEAGSVSVEGIKIIDPNFLIQFSDLPCKIKIGKRDFFEVFK